MIPKLINLCKFARRGGGELYLSAVVILVATISFGLGRLSKIREEKMSITIEDRGLSANSPLSTSNIDSGRNGAENTLQQNSSTISQSQKIFVASRNGKKYYYAWCESANVIKEQNRIWFATKDAAEKAGYQPAANCKGLK